MENYICMAAAVEEVICVHMAPWDEMEVVVETCTCILGMGVEEVICIGMALWEEVEVETCMGI